MSDKHRSAGSLYTMRDWRKSLGVTPAYRMGHTTLRFHFHYALLAFGFGTLMLVFLYMKPGSVSSSYPGASPAASSALWSPGHADNGSGNGGLGSSLLAYNQTYPLTAPVRNGASTVFRIGLIADLDQESAKPGAPNTWRSYYKRGLLHWTPGAAGSGSGAISVQFDDAEPAEVLHHYALKGRGMELSELVTFNGRLLTVDDRTGFVYEMLPGGKVVPWVVLMDGDGLSTKGFKSEWATVRDGMLWVGSMGKEWTTSAGEFESNDPMWVKAVTTAGHVHHMNWVENYKKIRESIGIRWPGYMIHESALWSELRRKWYFLPRRCSKEKYNETKDEHNGCNVLIVADENFHSVEAIKVGDYKPTHGFSSAKFVPGTDDRIIVALLTEELNGETSTYITAFDIEGNTLLPQQQIPTQLKYEGLDFV